MAEQGTLPFETIAGQLAAVDYIASLGTRFGDCDDDNTDKRIALSAGFDVIAEHEAALSQQFVSGLEGENAQIFSGCSATMLFVVLRWCVFFNVIHSRLLEMLCARAACVYAYD